MDPSELPLWQAVDRIREHDDRYRREAYLFVVAALGATVQRLPLARLNHPERRHLSGGELLRGVASLARAEFGSLAETVLNEWGVESSEDIGRIVFHLVESGQLSARPEDTLEDFRAGPDVMSILRGSGPAASSPRDH
jgi:uncharacterized repeat protein (TIGR04138 family)